MEAINAGLLKLQLLCRGARIDGSCKLESDTRAIRRTRGGLGSGLDAVLPDGVWVNIPVVEPFAEHSPFSIRKDQGRYELLENGSVICPLDLPKRPDWYQSKTSSGKEVGSIGVMQGTYFAVYPSELCNFWSMTPKKNCGFCSVGLCLGSTESETKSVQDVVEAVQLARKHARITFVHFNTGYMEGDRALDTVIPYVKAVKQATGLLVGVQCPPAIDLAKYDLLKKAGADHLSFCFELFDPDRFEQVCPGKAEIFGQAAQSLGEDELLKKIAGVCRKTTGVEAHAGQLVFYRALAYCMKRWGKGRVSGEIIAGLESPESTIKAIEFLAELGAVSTVCVFRPCIGTDLEGEPPPSADALTRIFARMYEVCIRHRIPIGIAPNIKTAMVHLPQEGGYFTSMRPGWMWSVSMTAARAAMSVAVRLNSARAGSGTTDVAASKWE